ncbi:hypothetical protein, partial [Bifidobacterium longum]|uniref:hypothetical protein n=1 Tax=Bifidobacterium longum TaxID=216816 RepID=UPI001BE481C4
KVATDYGLGLRETWRGTARFALGANGATGLRKSWFTRFLPPPGQVFATYIHKERNYRQKAEDIPSKLSASKNA